MGQTAMSILYANGWEAGSGTWYQESTAAWSIGAAGSAINASTTYLHRTPAGVGGSYSWRPGWAMSCGAGTVSINARWLMFWGKPETPGGSRINVQFGKNGSTQINVRFMETGNIELYRASSLLTTYTAAYNQNVSHWFAIKVDAAASGEVQIWLDGVQVGSTYTGDTNPETTSNWNHFGWGGGIAGSSAGVNSGGEWYIDDIMVTDASTGRLTEHFAPAIIPDGNGTVQLTPLAPGTNWQNVDEVPLSDAEYNSASNINDEDFYTTTSLPVTPDAIACVNVLARATATGLITQGQCSVKSVASTAYQTPVVLPAGSYLGLNYISETDPATSLAWDETGVNAMNIGIKFT